MRPPSSLRDSVATALAHCAAAVLWLAATSSDAATRASKALRGTVADTLRTALFGRRLAVSLLAGLLTVPLTVGSAWWVDANVGYRALVDLVTGTWYGTDPHVAVFLTAAVLVGLGAVSAGLNSGLLPTTGLVVAPVFGAAVTRYGVTVATWNGRSAVVSLPEAVAYAASVGVAFGVPIAVAGFILGSGLRRVGTVLTDAEGASKPAEQA